jgi:hypothetical protein
MVIMMTWSLEFRWRHSSLVDTTLARIARGMGLALEHIWRLDGPDGPETWDEHHMIKVATDHVPDHVHGKITPPDAMANRNAKRKPWIIT